MFGQWAEDAQSARTDSVTDGFGALAGQLGAVAYRYDQHLVSTRFVVYEYAASTT